MTDILRPDDLKKIADDADLAKAREHMSRAKKLEEEQAQMREAFLEREIRPEARERINKAIRRAAEQGQREFQVFIFPASFCTDKGRRINNNEADWPESLDGFAKKAHEFYEKELRQLGFTLHAQILDYPGGMPGNIAMVLKW